MVAYTTFIAAFLAATAAAQNVVTYNCNEAKAACEKNTYGSDDSICNDKFVACEGCATQEHSCRVGAGDSYPAQLSCTSHAEVCYQNAVSPGTTNGIYGCEQAFESCSTGTLANHSLCASQDGACKSCQTAENECRSAPEANQSYCSSQASECYYNAVTSNGEL